MPVRRIQSRISVLEAARLRIKNVFSNGVTVYMSFSSGKDSLCMSSLVYDLIRTGEIDPKLLVVIFIDEEGLYRSMVAAAERWRLNFLSVGARFWWFCLPFKQVSVIDHLSATESWITWEPGKEGEWMRDPPPYAIMRSSILHYPGEMNYQTFCKKLSQDGIQMIGLRTAESLTRLQVMSRIDMRTIQPGGAFYPIYDWKDDDIWMYIRDRGLEFPEIYMRLYEAGVRKNNLRLCCFFGDCSTQGLRWIAETDNELWERIERREPNAYLVLLYWDSEMFRRSSSRRKELEKEEAPKDYKSLCEDVLFRNTDKYVIGPDTKKHLKSWQHLYIKTHGFATQKHYKRIYEGVLYGDPKMRVMRIVHQQIFNDYASMGGVP